MIEVALSLLLQTYGKEDWIFDHGEFGDMFYIIIKGSVGVDIPIKQKISQDELEKKRQTFETEIGKLGENIEKLHELYQEHE